MKRLIVTYIIFIALSLGASYAFANEVPKKEIIDRCRSDMGEYGASMVKSCVDSDIDAFAKIEGYDAKYDSVKSRCMKDMKSYGFSMVESCIELDIEALNKIDSIPEEYALVLERCLSQMESYGFSMVYACAEQDIEAEEALKDY